MKPNKDKEEDKRRGRKKPLTEKIKTGADHKIGELAELDGAELARLSNRGMGKAENGQMGFVGLTR
jgi:hypothetical protein